MLLLLLLCGVVGVGVVVGDVGVVVRGVVVVGVVVVVVDVVVVVVVVVVVPVVVVAVCIHWECIVGNVTGVVIVILGVDFVEYRSRFACRSRAPGSSLPRSGLSLRKNQVRPFQALGGILCNSHWLPPRVTVRSRRGAPFIFNDSTSPGSKLFLGYTSLRQVLLATLAR